MLFTKADIEHKDGMIVGVASSSAEDRHGEVVDVKGWDLNNFNQAPRLLWAHDHNEPAIGKVTKTWFEGDGDNKKLMFEAVFQEVTEKARAVKELVKQGFINTFSVGFQPLEMDGNTITKSELLEISVVNVPANPDAMALAYKSLKKAGFDKKVIKDVGIDSMADDVVEIRSELSKIKEVAERAERQAELAVKGLSHLNPQRSKQVTKERLSMLKVIARASDELIARDIPKEKRVALHKTIKRSSEMLIRSNKGDL